MQSTIRNRLFVLVCFLGLSGCVGGGFQRLEPTQGEDYLAYLEPLRGSDWYYVQGRTRGDFNNDGTSEEAVLVTRETAPLEEGKPFAAAILLICSRDENGELLRQDFSRKEIFVRAHTLAQTPTPAPLHEAARPVEMRRCYARSLSTRIGGPARVMIALWDSNDHARREAWHGVYRLHEQRIESLLEIRMPQYEPKVQAIDLDRDAVSELVFAAAPLDDKALPSELEGPRPTLPLVYHLNEAGDQYVFQPTGEPLTYRDALMQWYPWYVQGIHTAKPRTDLAVYEYYISLLHRWVGDEALSDKLNKAAKRGAPEGSVLARKLTTTSEE